MLRRFLFRLVAVLLGLAGTFLVSEVVLQIAAVTIEPANRGGGRGPVGG